MKVKYSKTNNAGEEVTTEPIFRSKNVATTNHDEVNEQLARAFQQLYKAQEEFQREGSGWNLQEIILFEINTTKYQPLMGSSYIPLPKYLATKKAVINIKNEDQKCFVWSVLAQLYPCRHSDRVINYIKNEQDLNLKGVHFPTPLHDIPIFERNNNISINVFGYEGEVFPLYITKQSCKQHVNLLLLTAKDKQHYCLIKNFDHLMGDRTHHKGRMHYCYYCLHGFTNQQLLDNHKVLCNIHGAQKIRMPEDEWIHFKNTKKMLKMPLYMQILKVSQKG